MRWKLGIIETGTIPSLPLNLYLPDAPEGEVVEPVCYCFVATDGSRSVLIDSGPDRHRLAAEGLETLGDADRLLKAGLAAWDLAPADVTAIVHTHLHYDHMQNDGLFDNAEVFVQREELEWATGPQRDRFCIGVNDLVEALGDRLRPVEGDREIFPGLRVLRNGGHTPGHQSVILDVAGAEVCVCGDIVSMLGNLEVIGPICPDAEQTARFLETARVNGWEMLPSHDPGLRRHRFFVATGEGRPPAPETERAR